MIDTTGMDKDTERHETSVMYAGKRFYLYLVELNRELHSAKANGVTDGELGVFAELDIKGLIASARLLGKVPEWNDDKLAKFEYKTDVYRER